MKRVGFDEKRSFISTSIYYCINKVFVKMLDSCQTIAIVNHKINQDYNFVFQSCPLSKFIYGNLIINSWLLTKRSYLYLYNYPFNC